MRYSIVPIIFISILLGKPVWANPAVNRYLAQALDQTAFAAEPVQVRPGWLQQSELRINSNAQSEHSVALRYRPVSNDEQQAEQRIAEL